MKFKKSYELKEIASIIKCEYVGDPLFKVSGMNEIHVVSHGDIVFVDHPKYYERALNSRASVILINKNIDCPEGKALLISDDPFRDFNLLTIYFKPFKPSNISVSKSAIIGEGTIVQPNCFIGNDVVIGKNSIIHSNVSIFDETIIGDNVIIQSGTVLGGNAFYYKKRPKGYDQLKSSGRVIIENNVHLGSNCTIDRGVTGDTTIRKGTKLDNLIQVGHDTIIGSNCLIASQSGIAGCCIIENDVIIWGQVGINSGITIGSKSIILGQTGVTKSIQGGKTYFGTPVEESRSKLKELALLRKLPRIIKELRDK